MLPAMQTNTTNGVALQSIALLICQSFMRPISAPLQQAFLWASTWFRTWDFEFLIWHYVTWISLRVRGRPLDNVCRFQPQIWNIAETIRSRPWWCAGTFGMTMDLHGRKSPMRNLPDMVLTMLLHHVEIRPRQEVLVGHGQRCQWRRIAAMMMEMWSVNWGSADRLASLCSSRTPTVAFVPNDQDGIVHSSAAWRVHWKRLDISGNQNLCFSA